MLNTLFRQDVMRPKFALATFSVTLKQGRIQPVSLGGGDFSNIW